MLENIKKNKLIIIGVSILSILIFISIFGKYFTKYDISSIDLFSINSSPDSEHIIGTDDLGRDILARLLYGGRVSLCVGIFATLIQVSIGIILGTIAGYFGKFVDSFIMRIVDIVMCFPFL